MAGSPVVRRVVSRTLGVAVLLYAVLVGLRVLWPFGFEPVLTGAAATYGVDPDLIAAVTYAESRFRPDAVSPRGAIGLMQIMPATGAWIAEQMGLPAPTDRDLFDVERNVDYGSWYLRYLLDRFEDVETALRAYNAGPAAAVRWREEGSDPHPETTVFVRRVLAARPIYRFYFHCPALIQITPPIFF